ncbi:MAG TPA: sigma-70 family RNA polymerase sigma factor [Tepidisphaeraceae bacterium]|nr:sigma-70 family RNA polymerase sigma factor [Tepidisphaeraceae bacterium]
MTSGSPSPQPHRSPPARFATTQWSVVLAAANAASPDSAVALAELCRTYWYPIYAFVRRQGRSHDAAQDLTQDFFARLLDKRTIDDVGPEKGKFRTFLLVCLKRFLANEWEKATAQKRGGGRAELSIDFADADGRYTLEPSHDLTPQREFERRWALTVLERALAALADEFAAAGKTRLFDALKAYLTGDAGAAPYADVAGQLGMTEGAVKVAVHRLRERYRAALRREIAGTVADPAKVDEEIADLFAALGG